MRIFTEKAFQEELARRRKEREKEEYMSHRFKRIDEQIEYMMAEFEKLRIDVMRMREEDNT